MIKNSPLLIGRGEGEFYVGKPSQVGRCDIKHCPYKAYIVVAGWALCLECKNALASVVADF